jgi:hypothetical protein
MTQLKTRLRKLEQRDQQARSEHGMGALERWARKLVWRYQDLQRGMETYRTHYEMQVEFYKTIGRDMPPPPEFTPYEQAFIAQCEAGELERAHEIMERFEKLRDGVPASS